MKRGLMLACALAIGLAACKDNGDSLLPSSGGGGGVTTVFAAVNKDANIALTGTPAGSTLESLDTADFKGFLLDLASSKYSGFALTVPTPAAPAKALAVSFVSKAVEQSGATLLDNVRDALTADGTLQSFTIGFQNSFRGLGGSTVFSSRVTIVTANPVGVSALRNQIAAIVNGMGSAAGLSSHVTDTATDFTFSLTVIDVGGRTIVTFGLAPQNVFPSLPADVGDFNDGKTVVEADATLASDSDSFTTTGNASADILLLIDNSGSMSQKQQKVVDGMSAFFNIIEASGVDFQIGVARTGPQSGLACAELAPISTGTRFVTPSTPNALEEVKTIVNPGTFGSGNETGIFCAEQALYVDPSATNAGFNRANAKDIVMFVSDEGDQETEGPGGNTTPDDAPANYVMRDLATYESIFESHNATAFAIVGPATNPVPDFNDPTYTCVNSAGSDVSSGGFAYAQLASVTGGSRTSICADSMDWTPTFEAAALAASGGASQFTLQFTPIVSSVKVSVNGSNVVRDATRKNGFDVFLGTDKATVIFFGGARPGTGDSVEVTYDYVPTATP